MKDAAPWYDSNPVYSVGELQYGGIPNITSNSNTTRTMGSANANEATGAFYFAGINNANTLPRIEGISGYKLYGSLLFDASRSSSVYKNVTGVKPKRLYVGGYVIKY